MSTFSEISDFLDASYDTVIDVRAPAEFAEDHVPDAINLPVLDDAERARVGTMYVQESTFGARKIGAALVARNAATHLEGPLADKTGGWKPLIYCWRGGQRSNSFATILRQVGWRVDVLDGGYRTWRRLVVAFLHDTPLPHRFVLLDGYTGTAKTDLIKRVRVFGGQVLDLEGLAHHRGSIFGGLGAQPAQKGFESALAAALARLDPARPVLVEAESSRIGDLTVPASVWGAMCKAPRIDVVASLEGRATYLADAYADIVQDEDGMAALLERLVPLQGHAQIDAWKELAQSGAYETLARELMALHYDPRYAKSRARHAPDVVATIDMPDLGDIALDAGARRCAALLETL